VLAGGAVVLAVGIVAAVLLPGGQRSPAVPLSPPGLAPVTKLTLDEAAARAAAVHDGAEQRLQALTSRHTETMRELTAIRDSVTSPVAEDTARGSLDEEVAAATAAALSAPGRPPERVNG
jgi:hypothetical protein